MVAALASFGRDPLGALREGLHEHGEVFRLPGRLVVVAEPELAKQILDNPHGLYHEHSDFFTTGEGIFGPREAQLKVARGAKRLLQQAIGELDARLVPEMASWPQESRWPDAGNLLLHKLFGSLLAPPELRPIVESVVRRSVLAGARGPRWSPARVLWRRRTMRILTRAAASHPPVAQPRDLWEVVVDAASGPAGGPASPRQAVEVYLGLVFALTGSTGFLLAWSVWSLGTSNPCTASYPVAQTVREALRLWPVAWLLGRRPARAHSLGGIAVSPGDEVLVCPYLVHRNPRHWTDAQEFQPARWAAGGGHPAYLPFGWGEHACVGAGAAMGVVEQILTALISDRGFSVVPLGDTPRVGPALAPPSFILRLEGR